MFKPSRPWLRSIQEFSRSWLALPRWRIFRFLIIFFALCSQHAGLEASATTLSRAERDEFLAQHNAKRRAVQPTAANMRELVWDDDLAHVAREYARLCKFSHNNRRKDEAVRRSQSKFGSVFSIGENIYVTSQKGGSRTNEIATSIKLWDEEKELFTYRHGTGGTCDTRGGKMCTHYTQVAWARTSSVGCAIQTCDVIKDSTFVRGGTIVLCNYSPGGNINMHSQPPYASGTPCSQCPTTASNCNRGLCTDGPGSPIETQRTASKGNKDGPEKKPSEPQKTASEDKDGPEKKPATQPSAKPAESKKSGSKTLTKLASSLLVFTAVFFVFCRIL